MKRGNRTFTIWVIALSVVLILSIVLSIAFGSVKLSPEVVYKVLINKLTGHEIFMPSWNVMMENIIWDLRVPRVLLGALVGAGLAVAGVLMQVITKNPVADPYILGISSGASAGAVAVIVFGGASLLGITSIPLGAFIGSMVSGLLVLFIGTEMGRRASTTRIILTGIAISTIFSSLTNVLIYAAKNPQQANTAMFWTMGSLGGAKWDALLLPTIVFLISVTVVFFMSKSLDVMLLGEENSVILGMNSGLMKILILIIATLLTSTLVAISGAIGFIGLIIPHMVRSMVGSVHKKVIVISILMGAIFLIWADVAARGLFPPREIPIGIITSLVGGPFFLYLIRKPKYTFGGNE